MTESTALPKVGRYEFLAEPFHCDFSKHLFVGHLGNHLLNAADFHSNDRDFGMNYLNTVNKTWVLSRLAVDMEEMPAAYERFSVETWVESAFRYFTNRNFRIASASDDSKVYGYGRSIWALIDTQTRQPNDILAVKDGEIMQYVESEKICPIDQLSRLRFTEKLQKVTDVKTTYNDIDVNCHVNSVKYIEHVLATIPLDVYKEHPIKRFEVSYVAETYYGDTLHLYSENVSPLEYIVKVTKSVEGDDAETEVVRARIVLKD